MAKTFVYQWVKTHPGDTTTARLYQEYLETGSLPEELTWENLTSAPGCLPTPCRAAYRSDPTWGLDRPPGPCRWLRLTVSCCGPEATGCVRSIDMALSRGL